MIFEFYEQKYVEKVPIYLKFNLAQSTKQLESPEYRKKKYGYRAHFEVVWTFVESVKI